jgi:5'-3' exonuclease
MITTKRDPFERFKDDLGKVDAETFKKVSKKFLELAENKKVTLEVLPGSSTVSYGEKTSKRFLEEYNIDEETFSKIISILAYLLHETLQDNDNDFISKLKDEIIIEKIKDIFNFFRNLPQYSNIKARYLVIKYSKTNFFRNIDWEISTKNSQKEFLDESGCANIPFSLVKLSVEKTRTREKHISEPATIITMELSLPDAVELSKEFANIAEKLRKLTVTS